MLSRRALLVDGSGCDPKRPLAGPPKDIEAYWEFLKSLAGGAWENKEIDTLNDPDFAHLEAKIGDMSYAKGYFFFMFSGHGGSNGECDIVHLKGALVNIQKLVDRCGAPKRTFVLDSCRSSCAVEIPPAGYIIKEASKQFEISDAESRESFASALEICPNGTARCYACRAGQKAVDTPNGGLYTSQLIQKASEWSAKREHQATLNVHETSNLASWDVYNAALEQSVIQEPNSTGIEFPFAVATRKALITG